MQVNKKTRIRVEADLRPQIAAGLRSARKALGISQSALAEALGSSQGAITRWEREIDSPPISAFSLLAQLVPEEQRSFWMELAGQPMTNNQDAVSKMRVIPVLRDPAAAGTARLIRENEVDYELLFPPELLPAGGKLVAFKVAGDSMLPVLHTGFIVLVDTAQRDVAKLVGKMVAARDENGVTIKWLRKQGKMYLLVPQNTAPQHEVRIITEADDVSIVGEVVKWIGQPYVDKKRK